MSQLIAGLPEHHDRDRFDVIAFSLGTQIKDAMARRLNKGFGRVVETGALPDQDIAALARRHKIDIAIDLNGFTAGNRTGVFALRAAPLQVSYLGYPGTMGAPYFDYLIADSTVIPTDQRQYYAEKIAYLPDSYQPRDATHIIAGRNFAKEECGLPESGFIFCSFNNSYKFTPKIFDIWMRLLDRIDGSVLWLPSGNDAAMRNLRSEAEARGVSSRRLVFAPRLPDLSEHLARLRLADLFLDTIPFNAHTSASDALWAGLPVLSCEGETFPGRVGASLLRAVGLPELVTASLDEYETQALELARNPQALLALRQRLAARRSTAPLFDTALYTKHLEAAFTAMWQRHLAGWTLEHIHVARHPS